MNVENNKVTISGMITAEFAFSYELFGEKFYMTKLSVERDSGINDSLPIQVSDRTINVRENYTNKYVTVNGQFRSRNAHEEDKNKLILYVFINEIKVLDKHENVNEVFLEGFICRNPIYRTTPLGREVADILLAINRPYGKSDYIPCISWGRNARYSSSFQVGERCRIWGRIQSREYTKKIADNEVEIKIAYEVSICKMERKEEKLQE